MLSDNLISFAKIIESEYVVHYKSKLDFAIACEVDEKTIRRILKGEQNISFEILLKLSNALQTKPSVLLEKINL